MPPVVFVVLGAIGAVAAVKWLAAEARRINAELHPEPRDVMADAAECECVTLTRDPATGVFRPE